MSAPTRFLDVAGDLQVTGDAGELRVTGLGDRLVVEIPGLTLGRELLGVGPGRRGPFLPLARIDEALRNAGLGLVVTVKNRPVGRVGSGAEPRWLDQLFGMHPMQVHYGAVVQALVAGVVPGLSA